MNRVARQIPGDGAPGQVERDGMTARRLNWFSRFLIFFFLYLMADTFLEEGPFGSTITFLSLGLALVFLFAGVFGRGGRSSRGDGRG
jgi:hypothetical protein